MNPYKKGLVLSLCKEKIATRAVNITRRRRLLTKVAGLAATRVASMKVPTAQLATMTHSPEVMQRAYAILRKQSPSAAPPRPKSKHIASVGHNTSLRKSSPSAAPPRPKSKSTASVGPNTSIEGSTRAAPPTLQDILSSPPKGRDKMTRRYSLTAPQLNRVTTLPSERQILELLHKPRYKDHPGGASLKSISRQSALQDNLLEAQRFWA